MKIKTIRAVEVDLPEAKRVTPARRESWRQLSPIGLPMAKYPDYPPTVPLKSPGIGGRRVWCQVVAEDGTWGLGATSFGEPVAALIDYLISPMLEGRDCFATELRNDMMWRSSKRHGSVGISACAQSAVDLALWDLKGKLFGQPVYRLLGGPCRDKILCYATGDDLDWSMELGFQAFKITNPVHYDMGIEGLDRMEEKVAWARETVGPHAELMINPVMAYDVEFTIRLAERLRPYNLRWIEEPLFPEDLEAHMQIRKAITWVPLATGEDHHTRIPFRQLVEHRCVDVVQPDIHWCGGLSEAVRIYHLAEAAGIKTCPHGGAGSAFGQHYIYAFPEMLFGEIGVTAPPGVPLEEMNRIPGLPVPKDGYVVPSDAPGFGMAIDAEWIRPWQHGRRDGDMVAVL